MFKSQQSCLTYQISIEEKIVFVLAWCLFHLSVWLRVYFIILLVLRHSMTHHVVSKKSKYAKVIAFLEIKKKACSKKSCASVNRAINTERIGSFIIYKFCNILACVAPGSNSFNRQCSIYRRYRVSVAITFLLFLGCQLDTFVRICASHYYDPGSCLGHMWGELLVDLNLTLRVFLRALRFSSLLKINS